jgi:hypothetical protein
MASAVHCTKSALEVNLHANSWDSINNYAPTTDSSCAHALPTSVRTDDQHGMSAPPSHVQQTTQQKAPTNLVTEATAAAQTSSAPSCSTRGRYSARPATAYLGVVIEDIY